MTGPVPMMPASCSPMPRSTAVMVRRNGSRFQQQLFEPIGLARLAHQIDGAERACVPCVVVVVLAGEHQDLDVRRQCEQVVDELEALVRAMGDGGQAKIDERELRRTADLPQQALHLRPRLGDVYVEIATEHEV